MHLDIGFGFLKDFWGFSKLMRFLWNFWVGFCLNDPICSCIASHLHSHNVLCVYRCVISLLEPCVLVGLDWAEPMMFFFVARHMIMHFSCIRTILFSFWYICWLVLVYFYLFLSLSLSLSDSLHMTPKRKSTPSQNSLRSGASSYSTPLHIRFHDEKAHQDFSENFFKYGIHLKCHIILSNFSNIDLLIFINSRGWESFCEIPVSCPSVIIHEFYSHMHGFDYSIPRFITFV